LGVGSLDVGSLDVGSLDVGVAGDGPTVPMEERVVAATVRGRVASAASPMGLHHHEEREEVRLVGWSIVCVLDDVMRVEAISATASWPSAALIAFFQASTQRVGGCASST
jgi:hypothetical protein